MAHGAWSGQAGVLGDWKMLVTCLTFVVIDTHVLSAGMGKTSLLYVKAPLCSNIALTLRSSHVVENVQAHCFESENDSCAFHYCSLDNAASQKPVNIFGSILAQAAEARPQLVDLIKPFRRPMHSLIARNSMTLQDATKLLEEAFRLFKRFFVLIDALNEAPHQRVILRTLLLLTSTCPSLKVLITCTSDPAADRPVGSYILLRHMNKDDVNVDIRAYVCHRLGTEPNYQGLSDKIRQEVEISISSDADGMYGSVLTFSYIIYLR